MLTPIASISGSVLHAETQAGVECERVDGKSVNSGSVAALATTLTLATAINCIGIGFQRGTHTRSQLVANDGAGAPTLTDMGGVRHRDGWGADRAFRSPAQW
jgi:hypothetical protein